MGASGFSTFSTITDFVLWHSMDGHAGHCQNDLDLFFFKIASVVGRLSFGAEMETDENFREKSVFVKDTIFPIGGEL